MNQPDANQYSPQLGRNAALAHLLALLSAGVALFAITKLGNTKEAAAVTGIALSAAAALFLWSFVLAVRSLFRLEQVAWAATIIFIVLFECTAPSLLLWQALDSWTDNNAFVDWAVWLGIPVFVPVFSFSIVLGAALAFWLARRKEKKDAFTAAPPWTRARFFSAWLRRFCISGVLIALFLVPVPLFILGSCAPQFYDNRLKPSGWAASFADLMPVLGDSIDSLMSLSNNREVVDLRKRIIGSARLSKSRLVKLVYQNDPDDDVANTAWFALCDNYDDAFVLNLACDLMATRPINLNFAAYCGEVIGMRGNAGQIRPLLVAPLADDSEEQLFFALLHSLPRNPEKLHYLPDLEKLLSGKNKRQVAIAILDISPPKVDLALWLKLLNNPHPEIHGAALSSFYPFKLEVLNVAISHFDTAIRGKILSELAARGLGQFQTSLNEGEVVKWVRALLPVLNDPDPYVRYSAVCLLHHFCDYNDPSLVALHERLIGVVRNGDSPDFFNLEIPRKELERVRAVSTKWIEERQK